MTLPVCTIDANGCQKPPYATVLEHLRCAAIKHSISHNRKLTIFAGAIDAANVSTVQIYNLYSSLLPE